MNAAGPTASPVPAPAPLDRIVRTHHRYILPVLAGLSFFLGGAMLWRGPQALGPLAPLGLLGLGAGTLSASLAYVQLRHPPSAPLPEVPPYLPIGVDSAEEAAPDLPGATLEWEDLFYRRYDGRSLMAGASPGLRVLFTPTSAADQLWVHWLPADVSELPGELIPPVAETALDAGDWAEEGPFELAPDVSDLPAILASEPLGEIETSLIDPPLPVGAGTASLPLSPDGARDDLPVGAAVVSLSGAQSPLRPDGDEELPHWMRAVLAEALNPIPPHLRGARTSTEPGPAAVGVA